MKKLPLVDGQEVLTTNLEWLQTAKEEAILERMTDLFTDGILSQSAATAFEITDNGNGTFNIGIGVAFKDGERIEVVDAAAVYNSSNPTQTTTDGVDGTILTPKSIGVANIPIIDGATKYIGIKYLLYCDNGNDGSEDALTNYSLHPRTGKRVFYTWKDGYDIELQNSKVLLSSDCIYLGSVVRGGLVITPDYNERIFTNLNPELNKIGTTNVADGSITEVKLGTGAVTGSKIAATAAGDGLGKDGSNNLKVNVDDVTIEISADSIQIKNSGVVEAKLGTASVTENKLGALAVTSSKINVDAVTTDKILDLAITEDKLGNDAVIETKIQDGAVTENKIYNGSVTEDKIYNGSVTEDKIGALAVTTGKIDANAVTGAKLDASIVDNATIELNTNVLRVKAAGLNGLYFPTTPRSSGVWTGSGYITPAQGFYVFVGDAQSQKYEIRISSTWRSYTASSTVGFFGSFYTDGTNVRLDPIGSNIYYICY